ncbi:Uma2 family endonuclease [Runella salmonicolor]|uniref:Uma2 family endonuclease n=1 Tax=Runella salmonicolor TaxID=2950278 RepID=A0ABT1FGI6_9BACT|nr:Uma2 family endonuclease [Runella salmonicolor]MCP1380865.1 Uma2 family endonuclease [Runella salmonicolor]
MVALLSPETTYSIEEYFELEAQSLEKLEYFDGKITKMPGASYVHNRIATNVLTALNVALMNTYFEVSNSDTKIHIPTIESFVYPDAVVICEKPLFYQNRVDTILNPLLIVEVLLPSTEEYDRGEKFYLYRSLPSFKEYVVVHQKHALVSAYFRLNEKDWRTDDVFSLSETIHLQSINVTLKLSDIYRGIDLSAR